MDNFVNYVTNIKTTDIESLYKQMETAVNPIFGFVKKGEILSTFKEFNDRGKDVIMLKSIDDTQKSLFPFIAFSRDEMISFYSSLTEEVQEGFFKGDFKDKIEKIYTKDNVEMLFDDYIELMNDKISITVNGEVSYNDDLNLLKSKDKEEK